MKNKCPVWLKLLIVCFVCALLLALTYTLTKQPILDQEAKTASAARHAVLAEAEDFEEAELAADSGLKALYRGVKGEETAGYVAVIATKGFGGEVEVTVGVNAQGTVTGISVGGANFSETAGLGAKSKDAAFTDQFKNREVPLKVIKAGGEKAENTVDAITSATITSNAVTGAVNQAGEYVKTLLGLVQESAAEGNTATASAQGFGGKVAVTVTLDENGAISEITIGDENFSETPGFGAKALEPEFGAQFVGMTPPLELSGIDAISGATYTSTAVVEAINKAYDKIMNAGEEPEETAVETPDAEETEDSFTDAICMATASAQGFAGPVAVTVSVDEEGKIAEVKIGDDAFAETQGLGAKALEPEFAQQFAGMVPPLTLESIDAISGATFTSKAVVEAINAAYAEIMPAPEAAGKLKTASASAQGFAGPVAVTVFVDEEGKIAEVKIGDDAFAETQGLGAKALEPEFAQQFAGMVPPLTLESIDAISGATITSTAVVDAINQAYESLNAQ